MTAATERESQKRASRHDCVLRFLPLCDVPAEPGAYIDRKAARPTGAPGAPAETGACTGEKAERLAAGAPANPAERPGTPTCSAPLLFSLCDVPAEPGAYIDRKAARPTGAPAGPAGRRCTGRVLRPTSRSAPAEPGARTGEKAEKLAPGTPASPAGPAFPVGSDGRPRESRHKDAGSGSKAMSVSASMIIDYWRHAPEPHRLLFCGDCATTAGIFPPFLSSGTLDGGLMSRPADASTMLVTSLVPIIAFAVDEASFYAVAPCSSDPTSPGYIDYSEVRDSVPRELFNEAVLRFGESAAVLLATFGATCLEVTEFYGYKYGTIPVGLPRGFPIYYDDIPCRDWAALEPWEKVTALADAHGWLRPLLVTFIEKSKALSRDHRKILRNDIVAAFGLAPGPARVSPKREWPASLPGGLTVGTVPFGKFSFADFSRACGFHPAHWDASAVLRDWTSRPTRPGPQVASTGSEGGTWSGRGPSAPPPAQKRAGAAPPTGLAPPRRPAPAKPAAAAGNTDTADADADDDVDRPRASRSTRPPKRTKATEASAPKAPPAPADSADEGGESDAPPSPAEEAEAQAPPPKPAKSRKAKTADRDKALQFAETRDLPTPNPAPAVSDLPPVPPANPQALAASMLQAGLASMAGGGPPPPFWPAGVPSPFLQHQQQPRYSAASTVTPAGWVVQAPPHFAAPWPSSGTANHGAGMFPGFGARRPTGRSPHRRATRRRPPWGPRRPLRQPRATQAAQKLAPPAAAAPTEQPPTSSSTRARPFVPSDAEMEDEAESDAPGDEPAGEDDWAGDWDSDDTSTPQDASPHVDAPSESESAAPVYSGKATRGHAKEKAPLEAPAPKKARGDDKAKGATAQAKATAAEKAAPPAEPPLVYEGLPELTLRETAFAKLNIPSTAVDNSARVTDLAARIKEIESCFDNAVFPGDSQQRPFPDERITTALAKYGIACMRDLARFSHGLVLRDMGNSELRQAIAAFDQVGDVINRLPGGPTGPLGQLLTDWNALTRPVYKKLRDIAQTSAVLQACLEDDPLFKRLLKRLQDSVSAWTEPRELLSSYGRTSRKRSSFFMMPPLARTELPQPRPDKAPTRPTLSHAALFSQASQAAHSYGGVATFSYDDDGDVEDPGSGGPTHRGQQRGRAWKQARRQYGTAQPAQPQPHHRQRGGGRGGAVQRPPRRKPQPPADG
eukprot:tig00021326_g20296.t2